jgi:4-coumarate--CoA ligase
LFVINAMNCGSYPVSGGFNTKVLASLTIGTALLIRLVNDPMAAGYDLLHVKQINTGAAPLAQEIVDKLAKRFPKIAIRQAWGMTESTSALTVTPLDAQTYANAHTVGAVVPETTLKIVSTETGEEVAAGQSGEVGHLAMNTVQPDH